MIRINNILFFKNIFQFFFYTLKNIHYLNNNYPFLSILVTFYK